jgi:hypothetical protein
MADGNGGVMGDELVMGAAIGFTAEQVRPFLASLRNAGYTGSVVLFVDRALARTLREEGLSRGVTLAGARQWIPFRFRLLERRWAMRVVWTPLRTVIWTLLQIVGQLPVSDATRMRLEYGLALVLCAPMESRFLRYRRFLARHPYRRVLLTDVRDVLFQEDPFPRLPERGLAVSLETPAYTIATEARNAAWVRRVYGQTVLSEIGSNRVSCVGVTYGERAAISRYLDLMCAEIVKLPPSRRGIAGADTAIHNVLLWTGRLGSVDPLEPLYSPVATLNGVDEQDLRLAPNGKVLNADGSPASVLHQYDRVLAVAPRLRQALAR